MLHKRKQKATSSRLSNASNSQGLNKKTSSDRRKQSYELASLSEARGRQEGSTSSRKQEKNGRSNFHETSNRKPANKEESYIYEHTKSCLGKKLFYPYLKRKCCKEALFRSVLALVSIVIYSNSLKGDFVYDDKRAILENKNVVSGQDKIESWLNVFRDDFWGTPMKNAGSHKSYRPLVTLTFKLQACLAQLVSFLRLTLTHDNAQLVDTNRNYNYADADADADAIQKSAFSFHLVNVFLHVLVVDLVFQVSNQLFWLRQKYPHFQPQLSQAKSGCQQNTKLKYEEEDEDEESLKPVACLASLLFACHSIHVEAVTSLVGRAELLGAMFALLSFSNLLSYLFAQHNIITITSQQRSHKLPHKLLTKSCIYLGLACLSKENASSVILINILLIIWFALNFSTNQFELAKDMLKPIRSLACLSATFTAYVCLRFALASGADILPKFSPLDNPLAQDPKSFCIRHLYNDQALKKLSVEGSDLEEHEKFCSLPETQAEVEEWISLTKLSLPIFNLRLLLLPVELSYDWSLSALGLVKSRHDFRYLIAMLVYCSLFVFATYWPLVIVMRFFSRDASLNKKRSQSNKNKNSAQSRDNNEEALSLSESESSVSGDSGFDDASSQSSRSSPNPPETPENLTSKQAENQVLQKSQLLSSVKASIGQDKRLNKVEIETTSEQVSEEENWLDELNTIGWSLIWLVIPFLPASNLFLPVGFLVAERTLYLPSFGFCLLVANLVDYLEPVLLTFWAQFVAQVGEKKKKQSSSSAKQDQQKYHEQKGNNGKSFAWVGGQSLAKIMMAKFEKVSKAKPDRNITAKLALILPLLIFGASKSVERNQQWLSEVSLYSSNLEQSRAKSLANLATLEGSDALNFLKSSSTTLNLRKLPRTNHQEQIYRKVLKLEPFSADLHYNL